MSISPNFNDMGWIESIKSILKTDTAKNSAILLMANVISQLLGIVFYPILTRIYSPDDFGLLNLFVSIGGVLVLCSTAEYQYSIMLPKSEKSAVACFHVGFLILFFTTFLCVVAAFFSPYIASLFHAPALADYFWLMPLYVFYIGLWTLLNYWYTRKNRFKDMGFYLISQSAFNVIVKYLMGAGGLLRSGLMVGTVLAPILSIVLIIKRTFRAVLKPLLVFEKEECKFMAQRYANYPKYSLPKSVVNSVSLNLPILLLTPFGGLNEVGLLGMAITLSFRPLSMISGSLHQSLYHKFTKNIHNNQSIYPLFKRYIVSMLVSVIPIFIALYYVLPTLSGWFLGQEWYVSGEYIRLLLPWLFTTILLGPFAFLIDVFQKQKIGMYYEFVCFILRILGLTVGIVLEDFKLAVLLYSLLSFCVQLSMGLYYRTLIKRYEKTIQNFL